MNAAGSAYNIAEWIVRFYSNDSTRLFGLSVKECNGGINSLLTKYRKYINEDVLIPSPGYSTRNDYFLLGDIWNGHKHLLLNKNDKRVDGGMCITQGHVRWRDPHFLADHEGSIEHLIVELSNGARRNFSTVIKTVVEGWIAVFKSYDL